MADDCYNVDVVEDICEDFLQRHGGKDIDDCIIGAAEILLALLIEDADSPEDAVASFDALAADLRINLADHFSRGLPQ